MDSNDNVPKNPEPGWVFHPETGKLQKSAQVSTISNQPVSNPNPQSPVPTSTGSVSWTASEFIDHSKNFGWYSLLALGTVILGALVYLITKDIFSVIVIVFFAIVFGFIAGRKPQVLEYSVGESGINIGQKGYPYSLFKSFSVMEEIAIDSIVLSPLKRFMPPITLYFAPGDKDKIINVLSNYLPHEEKNHDSIEKLMQKIRF